MTTQVIECIQACTVTVQHEFLTPLLDLTPAQGGAIASAVLVVWATGWGIGALVRLIKNGGESIAATDQEN